MCIAFAGLIYLAIAAWTALWHDWQHESTIVILAESAFWPITYVKITLGEL